MKKILLSICLISSSLIMNAQDNWLTKLNNGLTHQTNFNLIKNFKDTLFVAGPNQNPYNSLSIYKSGDGTNFVEDSSLRLNLTSNTYQLSSIAANNNYMFLGTGSSSGASVTFTQVYKRDAVGNYTVFDSIRNYNLPIDNQANNSSYPKISGLQFYSPTGLNDSIYAFLSPTPFYNSSYVSVWKSSLTTPHWVVANAFPSTSDFLDCKATITWHGALYAAISGYQNATNYIISTNNGSTFTTVATSTASALGLPSLTKFTAFAVYKDTLMVSVSSSYPISTPVFYTVDGTNWHPYFTSAVPFDGVEDLKTFSGKLWIQVQSDSYLYPEVYYYSAKTGLKQSTAGSDFEANFWNGSSFRLDTLNDGIYSSGYVNNSSTGPNTGISYNNGALFELAIPKANFAYTTTPPICTPTSGFLQDNSVNSYYPSTTWYINRTSYGNYPPSSLAVGADTVSLVVYSHGTNSLSDSVSQILTVYPGFTQTYPSQLIKPNSICAGQTFSVTDTTKYTGANRPYAYWWGYNGSGSPSFVGDSLQQLNDTAVNGGTVHIYSHYMVSADGCQIPVSQFQINVPPADSLSGIITDQLTHTVVTGGKVYLFKQKSNHVGLGDSTGSVSINPINGSFAFANVLYGNYYLKAIADTNITAYKNSVGTYYNNGTNQTNYQWYNAVLINHNHCTGGNDSLKNIQVIETPPQTGNGVVSGSITFTSTFGHRLNGNSTGNQVYGSPLKGADVKLGKSPGGGCSARTVATTTSTTTSNAVYTYTFTGVDATFNYRIYIDIPNYGMDTSRLVSFTTSTLSVNNDYYVDSTMIRVQNTVGILKVVSANSQLSLYPNPASDAANIAFQNNATSNVNIQLYDMNGNQISTLYNQKMQEGKQTVPLNLDNLQLSPGVYFIRANINNTIETIKLTIIGK